MSSIDIMQRQPEVSEVRSYAEDLNSELRALKQGWIELQKATDLDYLEELRNTLRRYCFDNEGHGFIPGIGNIEMDGMQVAPQVLIDGQTGTTYLLIEATEINREHYHKTEDNTYHMAIVCRASSAHEEIGYVDNKDIDVKHVSYSTPTQIRGTAPDWTFSYGPDEAVRIMLEQRPEGIPSNYVLQRGVEVDGRIIKVDQKLVSLDSNDVKEFLNMCDSLIDYRHRYSRPDYLARPQGAKVVELAVNDQDVTPGVPVRIAA